MTIEQITRWTCNICDTCIEIAVPNNWKWFKLTGKGWIYHCCESCKVPESAAMSAPLGKEATN